MTRDNAEATILALTAAMLTADAALPSNLAPHAEPLREVGQDVWRVALWTSEDDAWELDRSPSNVARIETDTWPGAEREVEAHSARLSGVGKWDAEAGAPRWLGPLCDALWPGGAWTGS